MRNRLVTPDGTNLAIFPTMTRIRRFEDLIAWQRARVLAARVAVLTSGSQFDRRLRFREQFHSAAVSVMSNVAEGFERAGPFEFRQFLAIAKGSAGEVLSLTYHAFDAGLIDQTEFEALIQQTAELGKILGGLRRVLPARGPGKVRKPEMGKT